MRQSIQIKALLIGGRHDALIEFHARYNKLFASRLLLKLCEGILPTYKPSLALFDEQVQRKDNRGRVVNITIHRKDSPLMFAFYESLPHGARMPVMVNLMNLCVQLAEADRKQMERIFWGEGEQKPEAEQAQTEPLRRTAHGNPPLKAVEAATLSAGAVLMEDAPEQCSNENGQARKSIADPLNGFDTGL
ncbi:hypothetical protein [Pseudomonas oryzihabitans]|uniref:hypothetical protein n=1 Tax=Pseudomonas oryzihabitans TaxID=47885 RepID=UPI00119D27F9|nr:hypothetical protein [Pseudomonas oryzihabitans]